MLQARHDSERNISCLKTSLKWSVQFIIPSTLPKQWQELKTSFYTGINDKWKMALAQIRVFFFENMPCVSYCNPNPRAFDFLCTKESIVYQVGYRLSTIRQTFKNHLDSSSSNGFHSSIGDLSCSGNCSNFTRMLPDPNGLVSFLAFQSEGVGF